MLKIIMTSLWPLVLHLNNVNQNYTLCRHFDICMDIIINTFISLAHWVVSFAPISIPKSFSHTSHCFVHSHNLCSGYLKIIFEFGSSNINKTCYKITKIFNFKNNIALETFLLQFLCGVYFYFYIINKNDIGLPHIALEAELNFYL